MPSSGSNAGMEPSTPLINAIINNAVPLELIHQSDAASNRSHPVLFLVDSLPQIL